MEAYTDRGHHVFGPLPQLHRALVVLTALAVGVVAGAWIAHFTSAPVAVLAGALWGAAAGVLLSYVLLHDFTHRPRPVHVRRH